MTINFHNGTGVLLTEKQAAARLGVCVKTLRKRTKAGLIAYANVGTAKREIRKYSSRALDDYLSPKIAEKPPCLSIVAKAPKHSPLTSGLKAVDFLAIPKPATKKPPKP